MRGIPYKTTSFFPVDVFSHVRFLETPKVAVVQ